MLSAAALAAVAAPAPGASLGLDSTQPIAVNADAFLADLNNETGTYTGNVIVTQGEVRLHADEVTVHAPGGRASRMEANGNVIVDSPSGQAVGDSGVYDVSQQTDPPDRQRRAYQGRECDARQRARGLDGDGACASDGRCRERCAGSADGPRAGPVRTRARSRQGGAATSGKSRE